MYQLSSVYLICDVYFCYVIVMELSQRDRLSELVEELTTSGQPELNQDKMKEVKRLCRYVPAAAKSLNHTFIKYVLAVPSDLSNHVMSFL